MAITQEQEEQELSPKAKQLLEKIREKIKSRERKIGKVIICLVSSGQPFTTNEVKLLVEKIM